MGKNFIVIVFMISAVAGFINAQSVDRSQYEEAALSDYTFWVDRAQSGDSKKFKVLVVFYGKIGTDFYFDDFSGKNFTVFKADESWPAIGKNQQVTIYFTGTGGEASVIDDIDYDDTAPAFADKPAAPSIDDIDYGDTAPAFADKPAAPRTPTVSMIPAAPRTPTAPAVPVTYKAAVPAKILGSIPQTESNKIYRLQIGSFLIPDNAVQVFNRLRDAGLYPTYEKYKNYTRVVFTGIGAKNISAWVEILGAAGFPEIWCREEQ